MSMPEPDDRQGPAGDTPSESTPSVTLLDRREAIRRVTLMLGGVAVVGGSTLLTACETAPRPPAGAREAVGDFSADEVAFLDEIADTILPETDTPGAKAAAVGAFMALMVTDTYDPDDQAVFRDGMGRLDEACRAEHAVGFMEADGGQRLALLERLDREQMDADDPRTHYFRMMKQLSLMGYFTSEIGCTVARRYVESPGRFDPCVPYTPGETSWADHA